MLFIIPTDTCFGLGCFLDDVESYKQIYKIKWRNFDKPISIFVSQDYFFENIILTEKEKWFIQTYDLPFTLLVDKKNIKDQNLIKKIDNLPNFEIYTKIAFRIAHTELQKKLLLWQLYFFLTSANKSGQWEITDFLDLKKTFQENMEYIQILDSKINSKQKCSNIIYFNNNEINYLR
jgi:tRNA A37 threonylcarbamoyladenosine synthetase subunit TsaC/SUA5/YrdC